MQQEDLSDQSFNMLTVFVDANSKMVAIWSVRERDEL
jgi:hypothetical protein